jgi:hypothetical protein
MNSAIKIVWTQIGQQTCWRREQQVEEVIITSSSGSTQVAKASER